MINQTEYTARLAHYNAWLMDANREFGVPYPGYPEDKVAKNVVKVPKLVKAKAAPLVKAPRAKRAGTTKLDQAKALFKANVKLSRVNMIALFQEKLGMSKAGATTYFYNAQK